MPEDRPPGGALCAGRGAGLGCVSEDWTRAGWSAREGRAANREGLNREFQTWGGERDDRENEVSARSYR